MKKMKVIIIIILIIIIAVVSLLVILNNSNDENYELLNGDLNYDSLNDDLLNSNDLDEVLDDNNNNFNELDSESSNISTKDYTFTQEIIINDEDMSTKIIKNKLLKTAVIEIDLFVNNDELVDDFMDMRNLMTDMFCGMFQLAFFDSEGLDEFNSQIEKWNDSEYTITDDSPEDQREETLSKDILEGYKINKVTLQIIDENNENVSSCIITGKDETDIEVNKYFE